MNQDQNLLSKIRPFCKTHMTSSIVYIGNCPGESSLDEKAERVADHIS